MTVPVSVDVEGSLPGLLRSNITGVTRVVTALPANLVDILPVLEVHKIGGADYNVGVGVSTVDILCFAADLPAARALAHRVWDWLRYNLPTMPIGAGWVKNVVTVLPPAERPYGNPNVRRVALTVGITVHDR